MLRTFMTGLVALVLVVGMAAPAFALPASTGTLPAALSFPHLSSSGVLILQTMAKKSLFSFSGTRPTSLGVKDGQLLACPGTPNCVNSQSPDSDAEHYIAPLSFDGSAPEAIARLKEVITNLPRTEIIQQTENYLYAEFTTPIMGYVDDVEFFADEATGTMHVRSASRLGQSDLGLNRKRVEEIRAAFSA